MSGDLDSGTNSDTIMVCSINNKSGEIKLVSVYRDTYLDVNDGHYSKANSAYAGGGPERAINMLNKNLDLDITDFVTVDFNAVIKAVDLLGGIDIDLTDEEVKWLNAYLVETLCRLPGFLMKMSQSSGIQHLYAVFRRWLTAGSVIRRAGITSVPRGRDSCWRKSLQRRKEHRA